jgi:hypothetical protein
VLNGRGLASGRSFCGGDWNQVVERGHIGRRVRRLGMGGAGMLRARGLRYSQRFGFGDEGAVRGGWLRRLKWVGNSPESTHVWLVPYMGRPPAAWRTAGPSLLVAGLSLMFLAPGAQPGCTGAAALRHSIQALWPGAGTDIMYNPRGGRP